MNPALPFLALLTAGGAAAALATSRRWPVLHELGIAWGAVGLVAIALLAPALVLPTGIPSPAATLAELPPWHGTGDPAAGNPVLRDVTFQIQPWLLFLRSELRAGRLPFWNPHQLAGTPFWGNGQSAPLHPFHLLFAALPLPLGFALLPWLRLTVAGCGAFLLARALGLSRPAALIPALAFPFSGMFVSFALFPMGNALALVPWVLLATERLAATGRGGAGLALAAGLQLLGGHPETSIHTALLAALWLAVRGSERPLKAWGRLVAGWSAAAAIAAVQMLPLAFTLLESSKWLQAPAGEAPPLGLALAQTLRLVLPGLYGHPAAGTWWGPFNASATAVYAGAATLTLAVAGLIAVRRDRRLLAVAMLLAFSFAAAYQLPGVRHLLSGLPLLGRVAHHRLIFGVELGLGLLAGVGCDRWLSGRGRGLLAGAAAALAMLGLAWWLFAGEWSARGLIAGQTLWTASVATVALLLAASLALPAERRWTIWPLLPCLLAVDLVLAHGRIVPGLPLERLYPRSGAVDFLAGVEGRVAGLGHALRPNAAMVYGLFDVRGDDPVKLERYERVYARLAAGDPVFFEPIQRWNDPRLDRLGVRWVVAGPEGAAEPVPLAASGWRLVYGGTDARVFERPRALPLVRWAAGEGRVSVARREPGRWEIDWRSAAPGALVVAETWDPGWRGAVAGRPVAVRPIEGPLMGVELPAGEGRLVLAYRPPGLLAGTAATVFGLLVTVLWGRPWMPELPRP